MVLMAGEDTMDNTLEAVPSIVAAQGLTRMLSELKCQFDVILPSDPIPDKRLLVIGDDIRFSEELAARIRAFLENGGRIIASGKAGWRQDAEQFALSAAWQAESAGESPYQPGYFQLCAAEPGIPGVPPMPIVIHQPGIRLRARGARVAAETVAPLANRHFDGEHAWLYLPPEQPDGFAFLTIGAQVAHIGAPLGTNYYHHAQIPLRQLLGMMVHQLLPDPLLKTDGLPAFARVTITRQGTRRILWVTAFLPEKRGEKMEIVEDTIEINHAVLLLRDPGCPPDRCYRLPDQSPVSWQREDDGYVRLTLPPFAGYCAIALEF